MIYVKKKLADGITAEIELDDGTEFYTRCMECGATVQATNEILGDFSEFFNGMSGIICEKCVENRKKINRPCVGAQRAAKRN